MAGRDSLDSLHNGRREQVRQERANQNGREGQGRIAKIDQKIRTTYKFPKKTLITMAGMDSQENPNKGQREQARQECANQHGREGHGGIVKMAHIHIHDKQVSQKGANHHGREG